jgi:polysaccharide export outer membrane protein
MSLWSRLAFIGILCVLNARVVLAQDATYTVKPGDILKVSVWKEPDLQGPILIRPDGGFSFPLVGEVDGRGKTVAELQAIMTQRLSKYISDPVVSVSVFEIHGNKVYVIGQVAKPGEFIVNPSVDVMQALSMAGGMTAFASLSNIIILRHNGATKTTLHFDYTDVAKGRKLTDDIQLQSGDVVVVP